MPLIGDKCPEFEAATTQGNIKFPQDFKGKWIVFFSHPADFTPVCTTEFMTFAYRAKELSDINTVLVGLSVDSIPAHIAWLRRIKDLEWKGMKNVSVDFPLVEDISMKVANKFGMIMPGQSNTQAVRAVFIIDPNGIIRLILYYPLSTGRNFDEIKRAVMALQKADKDRCATPMNWKPGDDTIIPPPGTMSLAKERTELKGGQYSLDWFLCFNKES
jgi:peroxiredoxin (alkyl hydroperoxide reductase subunit C)